MVATPVDESSLPPPTPARVLAVDDNPTNRVKLKAMLAKEGHHATLAENGQQALDLLRDQQFDLVLLDIAMPVLDGYQVLEQMRNDPALRFVPVIVVSASEEMESVVRCVLMGAEDYLHKPFNPVLLRARIGAILEKKKLRDAVANQLARYVPENIARAIVAGQGTLDPVRAVATVMYCDIEQFTGISECMSPEQMVQMMNEYFPAVVEPITRNGGVVTQFIGDAIMATFNVPLTSTRHADSALFAAAEIQSILTDRRFTGVRLRARTGIATGVVVAGNVGAENRLSYSVYGDTVNVAARLQSICKDYQAQTLVAGTTVDLCAESHNLKPIGTVAIRGKMDSVAIHELCSE